MPGGFRLPRRGRSNGTLLLICCTESFSCFFGSYLRMPVLPLYAASLGAGTVEVGMINACFLLMAGLLSIPFGVLSERLGHRSLIVAWLAILSGSSFLLRCSTTPPADDGNLSPVRCGLAAFAPTMMSYVADFTPATHLGRAADWYPRASSAVRGVGFAREFLVAAMITALITGGFFLVVRKGEHENLG